MTVSPREDWAVFRLALQFLTRLPVPTDGIYSAGRMALTPRWYGGVGVVVGLAAALSYMISAAIWSPVIAAIVAVVAGLLVTGALHEDGLADTFDGLGGGRTRERALDIMRDSRIGSYGALALIGSLALRVAALSQMPASLAPLALVAGHALSRAAIVPVLAGASYLRSQGAGSAVASRPGTRTVAYAGATALLAVLPLAFVVQAPAILTGLIGAGIGHVLMRRWFLSRLGGYTGDCLGAVQQTTEIGLYLGLVAWA